MVMKVKIITDTGHIRTYDGLSIDQITRLIIGGGIRVRCMVCSEREHGTSSQCRLIKFYEITNLSYRGDGLYICDVREEQSRNRLEVIRL